MRKALIFSWFGRLTGNSVHKRLPTPFHLPTHEDEERASNDEENRAIHHFEEPIEVLRKYENRNEREGQIDGERIFFRDSERHGGYAEQNEVYVCENEYRRVEERKGENASGICGAVCEIRGRQPYGDENANVKKRKQFGLLGGFVLKKVGRVRNQSQRGKQDERKEALGPSADILKNILESEKKSSGKNCENPKAGVRGLKKPVRTFMPDGYPRQKRSNRQRKEKRRVGMAEIRTGFRPVGNKPNGEQNGKKHRKRRETAHVGQRQNAKKPEQERVRKSASKIERLPRKENGGTVKEASEQGHRMAGFLVIANEQKHERRRVRSQNRRYENSELRVIRKLVPIGGEIQYEADTYENRSDNRKDGNELRTVGFLGFRSVMGQKPVCLGFGDYARLEQDRKVRDELGVNIGHGRRG